MEPQAVFRAIRHKPSVYIERGGLDAALRTALAIDRHILLHGPAGQGKTTLLLKHIELKDCCVVDCRSDIKRKDIYRILLVSAGYSVVTERKRKGKLGTSAHLKLFGSSLGGEAGGELETHMTELTADITNGTEVAGLLAKTNPKKFLLLNNFDFLPEKTQEGILQEIGIFDEWSSLRLILSGRWSDPYYAEKLFPDISGKVEKIHVPWWSKEDLRQYFLRCSAELEEALPPSIVDAIISISGGDIGLSNQLALLFFNGRAELSEFGSKTINAETFLHACKQHFAKRYADIYLSRLQRFAGSKNLQVLFVKTEDSAGYKTKSTIFDSFDDVVKEFGPEKARKIKAKLKKDSEGKLRYSVRQKVVETKKITCKVYIGLWILALFFHPKMANSEKRIAIDDAMQRFKESFLVDVLPYNEKKLRNIIMSLAEVQRDEGIVPEIFSIDQTDGTIFVSSRQIEIFFESSEEGDVYGEISEYVDNLTVGNRIKKRCRITSESAAATAERVIAAI